MGAQLNTGMIDIEWQSLRNKGNSSEKGRMERRRTPSYSVGVCSIKVIRI